MANIAYAKYMMALMMLTHAVASRPCEYQQVIDFCSNMWNSSQELLPAVHLFARVLKQSDGDLHVAYLKLKNLNGDLAAALRSAINAYGV